MEGKALSLELCILEQRLQGGNNLSNFAALHLFDMSGKGERYEGNEI